MERATRVGGLFLRTDEPDRLGRWYAEHLGVETAPGPDGPARGFSVFTATPTGSSSASFEVRDLDAMVSQLHAAGIEVEVDPAIYPDGRFASLRDPGGNLVQLWQPAGAWSSAPSYVLPIPDGPDPGPAPSPRIRRSRWLPLALAALIAVVFIIVANRDSEPAVNPIPTPSPTTTTTAVRMAPSPTTEPTRPVVSGIDRDLLGVRVGWDVFAYASGELIRVEFARGRVTRTPLPVMNSTGPIALIAGSDRAVIRPLDAVAGFVVPDGRPAEELPGRRGGQIAGPGPEPDQMWLQTFAEDREGLVLVELDGTEVEPAIPMPTGAWPIGPDGRGNVLVGGIGGVYLVQPDGPRRVTTGVLNAAGPTHFLVTDCDDRARCSSLVIDRNTGRRRGLDVEPDPSNFGAGLGTVSPDGSHAAVVSWHEASGPAVQVIDLETGKERHLDVELRDPDGPVGQVMAFSPDGSWLFVASPGGLRAVDMSTGKVTNLEVTRSPVSNIAVRAEP